MTTLARWQPRPMRDWSLGSRVVVLFLGLLLAIQAAAFFATQAILFDNARRSIAGELDVGERALQRLLAQSANRLVEASRVLSADFGFRAAVASGDLPTIQSALDNQGARIGASVAALLDTRFALRASSSMADGRLQRAVEHLGAAAQRGLVGESLSVIEPVAGAPMQLVLVPLKTPLLSGWVLMGFALDPWLARDLRSVSALDLAVLVRPQATAPWAAPISTTAPEVTADLLRAQFETPARTPTAALAGAEYGWRSVALTDAGLGVDGAVQAVLLRSVDEAVRPYERLRWLFAAITALGMLAFAVGGTFTARRITQPVRWLLDGTRRVGAGDYQTPIRGSGADDEIGQLSAAFERMRCNVAQQQLDLSRQAYEDALTGLPNRLRFGQAVNSAIRERESRQSQGPTSQSPAAELAVLVLNLDRFKHVNDVLGYAFGDRVLQAVAGRLREQLAAGDELARLGADAFALLLLHSDRAQAMRTALAIAASFDRPLSIDEQTIDLGAGIGIACWPDHADAAEALLSRAEVAMRSAKRKASGPQHYDSASDSTSSQTLSLLSELRRAVELGELRLFLQPKVAFDDGRLLGAEALLRWQHPERGMVPPMDFIPFAEQTGFVRRLTLWVFEASVRAWRELPAQGGRELRMSVNLSTHDLLDNELPDRLLGLLARHGAPAAAFCLEITESAIMDDPQRAQATLERLREAGFKLSIDDFGTGYSSLAYLKRLPVDELKIDKSFVIGMERDADDAKIVRSTIDLAHNLGLTVVAEGVENAAIWNLLHLQGCDEGQGYHMSRPLPAAQFAAWAMRWTDHSATGWGGLELQPQSEALAL